MSVPPDRYVAGADYAVGNKGPCAEDTALFPHKKSTLNPAFFSIETRYFHYFPGDALIRALRYHQSNWGTRLAPAVLGRPKGGTVAREMTRKERIQWGILIVLVVSLLIIVAWNVLQPGGGEERGVAVFDEILRRKRNQ